MMGFSPVATLEELDSLDGPDMVEGYISTKRGDPEPGENRGKAFWHGWRTRMMDLGEIEIDPVHRHLVHLEAERRRQARALHKDGE